LFGREREAFVAAAITNLLIHGPGVVTPEIRRKNY
jgi:hypothetical protein